MRGVNVVMGIDPGLSGGVACILPTGRADAQEMPVTGGEVDGQRLADMIRATAPDIVIVEKVASMPRQGVSSTFKFGKGYGTVLGVLEALRIPYRLVTPQAWKKSVLAGTTKDKAAAINFVRNAYPETNLMPGRKRTPHDGIADAVCLAEYGRTLTALVSA